MKSIFLFFFLCGLCVLTANAQPNCNAPDAVRAFYHRDAQQLAVRLMQQNVQYQDSVEIPDFLYNRSMRLLLAVYNAVQLHERDTVVECLAIHTFPQVNMNGITVAVNSNETWVQNYIGGVFPTGNADFDGLITHYNLSNAGSFSIGNTIYLSLFSQEGLNMPALVTFFQGIAGVQFAEVDTVIGDGNDINVQETLIEDTEITYTAAWGDCPSGCIYSRNWKFRVKLDCGVQFLEVYGSELNEEVSCSNTFACATEPLCLDWLRDTVAFYQAQFPECDQPSYGAVVTQMQNGTVIGLHYFIGDDFDFVKFYTCDGSYLGQCLTTIAGPSCDSPLFPQFLETADTIWTCEQPFPTAQECGVLRANEPPTWAASVQVTPNPSTGWIQVSAAFGGAREGSVDILNVLGQTVLQRKFKADTISENIDLQGVAPGVYFVRVSSGGQQSSRKVVVQR